MMRDRFSHCLPSPCLRAGALNAARKPVKRVILFGQHPNPSGDYYFSARLAAPGMPEFRLADISDGDLRALDADGAFVIFCRYASARALDWLDASAGQIAGVGLFLDDDIPAVVASRESGIRYKLSLFKKALWPLNRLNRHLDIVWVSTPRLARELAATHPRILPPAPPAGLWKRDSAEDASPRDGPLRIAFHATGIHVEEHRFLQPVMRDILDARPRVNFEVFADRRTAHLWRGSDRIVIRKPLPWRDYVEDTAARRIDVMLVPLSPSHVNDCRSATKRIDVARAGAAGLFSASEAYGAADASGEIRIPHVREVWREAILTLIDDPALRARAAQATRLIVEGMTRQAADGLSFGGPS